MDDGLKGYIIGNSVVGNAANNLRRLREDYARRTIRQTKEETLSAVVAKYLLNNDKEGAQEYLNARFMEEIIDDCQHQADRNFCLETILKKRKEKYSPYYARIGNSMPEKLSSITADELCKMVGVENLHVKDSRRANAPIIPYESKEDKDGCSWLLDWWGWIGLALFAIGFVIYMKYIY